MLVLFWIGLATGDLVLLMCDWAVGGLEVVLNIRAAGGGLLVLLCTCVEDADGGLLLCS